MQLSKYILSKIIVPRHLPLCLLLWLLAACTATETSPADESASTLPIRGADISFLPQIRLSNTVTRNADGQPEDMLTTLKRAGVNTIRLKIWVNPKDQHAGFAEVQAFAKEIKDLGMEVWLTVHYSDTWADPGAQSKPARWAQSNFAALQDSLYNYTRKIVTEIPTDYIQIGNEINNGLLWPDGHRNRPEQMKMLLQKGIEAVRAHSDAKIMLHFAGHEGALAFYNNLKDLDFDLIGLSYYPFWHGKSLTTLQEQLLALSAAFEQDIIIAETAYPFTFAWADQTNNIIGLPDQILPEFPATPQGQLDFLLELRRIIENTPRGTGLCYWAPEWIAFKGNSATDGSSWENQALWGFDFRALPGMTAFRK